jgi:hypothetical protein
VTPRSYQSSVTYGYVAGVHRPLSNHTGYGAWRGPLLAPADVAEVIAGIADRGVLGSAGAVLSKGGDDQAMDQDYKGGS